MRSRLLCCSGSLEGGGSERQLWQLATKINRETFDPSVYLLYRQGKYLDALPSEMPVYDYWSSPPKQRRFPGAIRASQIQHLGNVISKTQTDVVYDRTYHMTLVTAAACRKMACPRVSTIVSPPSKDFANSQEKFKFFKKRILRSAYREPGCRTLAVSDGVADDAADYFGISRDCITVVPSPIDVAAIRSLAKERQREKSAETSVPSICVVGRMTSEKRQWLALLAVQEFVYGHQQPIRLDLVGDGPDRKSLEEQASSLGIQDNVVFHGHLDNPYPIMASADALLLPSLYEGLPNVVMEAMVLKTPVIALRCSTAIDDLVGENQRGLKIQQNHGEKQIVSELSVAISTLGNDRQRWAERVELAEDHVISHHSLDRWLSQMSDILLAAVRAKPSHSSTTESV